MMPQPAGGPKPVGPDLPGVLVIHCSDGRFQPHFQDFLRRDLGVEHYTLVAVPGGRAAGPGAPAELEPRGVRTRASARITAAYAKPEYTL